MVVFCGKCKQTKHSVQVLTSIEIYIWKYCYNFHQLFPSFAAVSFFPFKNLMEIIEKFSIHCHWVKILFMWFSFWFTKIKKLIFRDFPRDIFPLKMIKFCWLDGKSFKYYIQHLSFTKILFIEIYFWCKQMNSFL